MSAGPEAGERAGAAEAAERRTLRWVLAINLSQALLAGIVGVLAQSTSLLGAALDNLGDAAVYVASLRAVGRPAAAKARAARLSGILLILMAALLLTEIVRRFLTGSDPVGPAMIATAVVNAATNVVNLRLLRPRQDQGVHLKASMIFTSNDMVANLGIALSGLAVMLFRSPLPDLLIGIVVVAIVMKGGWEILEQAREASRGAAAKEGEER